METSLLLILIMAAGITADQINPEQDHFIKTEDESVTLKCSYKTSSTYAMLYWYRQYPDQAPAYLLRKEGKGGSFEHIPDKKKIDTTTSSTFTELKIKVLTLADTALYYCALKWLLRLGYTAPLTFGKAISLQVTPKNPPTSLPSLSILTAVAVEGSTLVSEVCLAESFGPNEGQMTVEQSNGRSLAFDMSQKSVLSFKTKTYYFAASDIRGIKSCSLQGVSVNKSQTPATQPTNPPKPIANITCDNTTIKTDGPKINFMSLLVTGVRIVFAKAVAVNVAMTIKVLVF